LQGRAHFEEADGAHRQALAIEEKLTLGSEALNDKGPYGSIDPFSWSISSCH
jgi:hypothetical protein